MNYQELIEESKKWGKWYAKSVLPNTPEACITVMHDSNTGNDEPVVEVCWSNEEFSVALAEWIVKLNNEAANAIESLAARVAELEALQTPRPIKEAPVDGTWILAEFHVKYGDKRTFPDWHLVRYKHSARCEGWHDDADLPCAMPERLRWLPLPIAITGGAE